MTLINFIKFQKYLFKPDLSQKFLIASTQSILPLSYFNIYFKYIFNNKYTFEPLAIKVLLMMESIYPKRCSSSTRVITLRFGRTTRHTSIWIKLNFEEFLSFYSFYITKPMNVKAVLNSYLKETKYFLFPGQIKRLKFPFWERHVNLTFEKKSSLYLLFFYKAAFLD